MVLDNFFPSGATKPNFPNWAAFSDAYEKRQMTNEMKAWQKCGTRLSFVAWIVYQLEPIIDNYKP